MLLILIIFQFCAAKLQKNIDIRKYFCFFTVQKEKFKNLHFLTKIDILKKTPSQGASIGGKKIFIFSQF